MRNKLKMPVSLKDILPDLIRAPVADEAGDLSALQATWKEFAGGVLSRRSLPLKIYKRRLMVGVMGSSWAQELQYSKTEILEKIHRAFPHLHLEEMRFQITTDFAESSRFKTNPVRTLG